MSSRSWRSDAQARSDAMHATTAVGSGGLRGGRVDGIGDHARRIGDHSSAEYDRSRLVELEGEAVSVLWRNPHVLIEVAVADAAGRPVLRNLEGAAVSSQRRRTDACSAR